MNIFYLDQDVRACAAAHADKHVCKMVIEYAQLLSTAHFVLDGKQVGYKPTHKNHPCAVWVRENSLNYNYIWRLLYHLLHEYTSRYGKVHATDKVLLDLADEPGNMIFKTVGMTPPPQCMPDDCKRLDTVEAYRQYYRKHKKDMATWKNGTPEWFNKKEETNG